MIRFCLKSPIAVFHILTLKTFVVMVLVVMMVVMVMPMVSMMMIALLEIGRRIVVVSAAPSSTPPPLGAVKDIVVALLDAEDEKAADHDGEHDDAERVERVEKSARCGIDAMAHVVVVHLTFGL